MARDCLGAVDLEKLVTETMKTTIEQQEPLGGRWARVLDSIVSGTRDPDLPRASNASRELSFPTLLGWSVGEIRASWQVQEALLNSQGVLFGGYYAVLADVALAFVVMSVLGDDEYLSTVDLSVSYFRPVRQGALQIECRVVSRGRSLIHTEASFFNDDAALVAKAKGTFAVVGLKPGLN